MKENPAAPPFKPGDKVVCIDPGHGNRLEENEKYIVISVSYSGDYWLAHVKHEPSTLTTSVFARRFKLAQAVINPHIVRAVAYLKMYKELTLSKVEFDELTGLIAALETVE